MTNINTKKEKPKGQALLIVLVISTLTLLLLMGVAARIDVGRTNIRRSGEFDRAVAASDNALNQVIKVLEKASCPLAFDATNYKPMEEASCPALREIEDDIQVFGKEATEKTIETDPKSPISLFLGDTTEKKIQSTGIRVVCDRPDSYYKFIVTRVYQHSDGSLKVDKGVTDCASANVLSNPVAYPRGNVNLYGVNAANAYGIVSQPHPVGTLLARPDTKLIRVRPIDMPVDKNPVNKISIELIDGTTTVASTGKYDFIIVGAGGLGSDAAIKFQKQRGDYTYVPAAFDFVYFGDELP